MRSAGIRVRDVAAAGRVMIAQQPDFLPRLRIRGDRPQVGQVLAVHREHVVKLGEMPGRELLGAKLINIKEYQLN